MRKALVPSVVFVLSLAGAFPVYASTFFPTYLSTHTGAIDYVSDDADGFNTSGSIGKSATANSEISFRYVPGSSHNICSVVVSMAAVGSPTDAVFLNVGYWGIDSNGQGPTLQADLHSQGSIVGSADSGWQVRGAGAAYVFSFTPCLTVVGSNRYNFNFYRSGSFSNTDYYEYGITSVSNGGYTQAGSWDITKQINYRTWSSTGVTNSYPAEGVYPLIAFYGTENFGASMASSSPTFAQSVINTLLGISETNATSTLTGAAGGWTNIPSFFARKVPWGYIFDIANIYDNAATSTTEFAAININFASSSVAANTRQFLPASFTIFSTTTVSRYMPQATLDTFNTLLAAAGWLLALRYWFNRGIAV